jgi:tripartite-type tricarboxylate transporter receptor subunit TctC
MIGLSVTSQARALAVGCALALLAGNATASDYPTRPIKFLVPWPAGGVADTVARVVGEKLSERLGQPVVVENRPGASGNIGMAVAAAAPANGYTLVLTPAGNLTVNQTLYRDLTYDVERDFEPITILATVPNVVVVSRSVPADNLAALVAYARGNPGKLTFASPGQATGAQLGGELLKAEAGIDMLHVAYTGIAPAVNDLLGDRISLMFLGISSALPQIQAGSLRAIAVATPARVATLPDVPTVAESGYPGFDVTSWYGVVVRSGTPPDITSRLYGEISALLKLDDVKDRFAKMGVEPGGIAPDDFSKLIRAETKKWGDIIVRANIKAE